MIFLNDSLNWKLLWENLSPNAAFVAQTITLSSDDYDALLIFYKYSYNANRCMSDMILKGFEGFLNISTYQGGQIHSFYRSIKFVNDISLVIENASDSGSANNNNVIPLKIYGIKT